MTVKCQQTFQTPLIAKLLPYAQFWFCPDHSTLELNTTLVKPWIVALNFRDEVRINIRAAFDYVWHPHILIKVDSMGVKGKQFEIVP